MTIKASNITATIIPIVTPIAGSIPPIATPTAKRNNPINSIKKFFMMQQKL